jgi:large subunit ribosomal protein L5
MAEKTIKSKAEKKEPKLKGINKMREIKIVKLVLSVAGTAEKLERGAMLLKMLSGMTPMRIKSRKRIPTFGVRPGLETGCKVTIRKGITPLLKRLLTAVNNEIKERQIVENHFSFGISEYIEIPGTEYNREIGIMGLNITVDFERSGKRVERKKIKRGRVPAKQQIPKEEILEYMKNNFETKIEAKKNKGEEDD